MFKQIELEYGFDALEPYIDTLTMETHYTKHHAAYTNNLNKAAQQAGIDEKPIEIILAGWKRDLEGQSDAQGIRNNGGGFYNHNLYFGHMSPDGGGQPAGVLAEKINETFGSFADFQQQLANAAISRFGSGWAWLAADKNGVLSVCSSPNQDNPILETEGKLIPILGIDVWEHAYYLKYKNLRPDYVKAFFHVIDWNVVADNYLTAGKS